jgi:hypothetical protein
MGAESMSRKIESTSIDPEGHFLIVDTLTHSLDRCSAHVHRGLFSIYAPEKYFAYPARNYTLKSPGPFRAEV